MRTLHIVAKGWGLGLIVDYEGEPKKPAKAPPPVRTDKSVTRVTPQPVRRRRPQGDGWPEHLCWVSGLTVFGLFFGYLGLQGGGPAAWIMTALCLTPLAFIVVAFPVLLIGSALVGRPRNVAPPRASAVGASARDGKGR